MKVYVLFLLFMIIPFTSASAQETLVSEEFSLNWEVRGEKLIVDLTGPGTGWLGFGLEDNLIICLDGRHAGASHGRRSFRHHGRTQK